MDGHVGIPSRKARRHPAAGRERSTRCGWPDRRDLAPLRGRLRACTLSLLLLGMVAGRAGAGPRRDRLHLAVGPFDDDPGAATMLLVEHRSGRRWLGAAHRFTELLVTDAGAYYLGTGLFQDLELGRRVLLTPSLGVGFFEDGGDKDLGHHVEFRAGVEVAVEVNERLRLGFQYHHLSNCSLNSRVNPGAEAYVFTLSFPLGR